MASRVNLLPWRQQRRRRFWRFWCLLLTGSVFVTGLLAFSLPGLLDAERVTRHVMQDANALLLREFAGQQTQLGLRQKKAEFILFRRQQQAQTEHWQHILTEIAGRLPERIWLTQLEFRQDILRLTGYSFSVSDLRQLDAALRDISGLRYGQVGKTQRDTQGRWQFHYQISREPNHAATP